MAGAKSFKELALRLHALAVFRSLLQNDVLQSFLRFLDAMGEPAPCRVDLYCAFVAALYEEGGDFGRLLLRLVEESDNPAIRRRTKHVELPAPMQNSLAQELAVFTALSQLGPADVAAQAAQGALPLFENTALDFDALYTRRMAEVATRGYGIFAGYHMFTLGAGGALCPVKNPDPQRLADLTGYDRERRQVVVNTRALLRGLPANNILLYGDAGTGKSSTVKAIANEYAGRGLRLVEIRKNQLYQIPTLMDQLAENPLRFILFIDDLSFPADDADFTALKAILEGNVSARPRNIVVYATSNRRHMVREQHAARKGDDLHLADTLEEEASLAARFGLTVTFLKPDRDLYAEIVAGLAREYHLATPPAELFAKAETHAIRHGGRSPRTARQFIEFVKAAEQEGESALV